MNSTPETKIAAQPPASPPWRRPFFSVSLIIFALVVLGGLFFFYTQPAYSLTFDSKRAMADIKKQCDFGPRIPGTPGHIACRDWIKDEIQKTGLHVWEQPFKTDLALIGQTGVPAFNLWGLPAPLETMDHLTTPFLVISAHWDTRPKADQEKDPTHKEKPILGANDGGSGVAMALEIARAVKGTPLAQRLVLIFFDAEDSGIENRPTTYCLGAHYAAAHLPPWFKRIVNGVNLDMVAGKGIQLRREMASQIAAPHAVKLLWKIGRDLAPEIFLDEDMGKIVDDHLAFTNKQIPYLNVIGWGYPEWHTLRDVPESCDEQAMKKIGTVMLEFAKRHVR